MYLVCAHPVWVISPFGSFNFLLSLFGNMEIAVLDCSCLMCFLALQWLSLSLYILVPGILVLAFHSPTLLSPNDLHLNINFRMAKPSEGAAQAVVGPGWYLEDSEYTTFKVHSPETKGSLHHFTIFFLHKFDYSSPWRASQATRLHSSEATQTEILCEAPGISWSRSQLML